jgi:hypothetical protein
MLTGAKVRPMWGGCRVKQSSVYRPRQARPVDASMFDSWHAWREAAAQILHIEPGTLPAHSPLMLLAAYLYVYLSECSSSSNSRISNCHA